MRMTACIWPPKAVAPHVNCTCLRRADCHGVALALGSQGSWVLLAATLTCMTLSARAQTNFRTPYTTGSWAGCARHRPWLGATHSAAAEIQQV